MLQSIFYARFHPLRGPTIIHQYPPNSIKTTSSHFSTGPDEPTHRAEEPPPPHLAFADISSLVIPPYDLCGRPITVRVRRGAKSGRHCRVLGLPVSLEDAKYARNRFTFNVCFVVDEHDAESEAESTLPAWESVVRKTSRFFRQLELDDGLLSREDESPNHGIISRLLQSLVRDLRLYNETCIRISDVHVLNLRLSAGLLRGKTSKVHPWDVPLSICSLPAAGEWTWDLTLQRIWPEIDGTQHVGRIAERADVEVKLVQRAVKNLVFHGRVVLLDLFHFQAIYALTEQFAQFVADEELMEECRRYVAIDPANNIFTAAEAPAKALDSLPDQSTIIELYHHISPGVSVHDFCLAHQPLLRNIDIRRFITFAVLKGFLRRAHRYALAVESPAPHTSLSGGSGSKPRSYEDNIKDADRAWKKAALTSGWDTPPAEPPGVGKDEVAVAVEGVVEGLQGVDVGKDGGDAGEKRSEEDEKLRVFLDGSHCLDEVCMTLRLSERQLMESLTSGRFGEVVVFCK